MSVKIDKGSALGQLNLTPMIDCVFLLLIFFLVATRFSEEERELDVKLPSASEAQPLSKRPDELIVNVDKDGRYFVQRQELPLTELERVLVTAHTDNPTQSVIIRADKRCLWESVVAVMNACNKAKIFNYQVTTADGPKSPPPRSPRRGGSA